MPTQGKGGGGGGARVMEGNRSADWESQIVKMGLYVGCALAVCTVRFWGEGGRRFFLSL
jgi:hypothetical protein